VYDCAGFKKSFIALKVALALRFTYITIIIFIFLCMIFSKNKKVYRKIKIHRKNFITAQNDAFLKNRSSKIFSIKT